jgi:hypothetical protein
MKIFENLDINDLDGEIWKDILDYEGEYQVSNIGRVKSFKKYRGTNERISKQNKNNTGRFGIKLFKNGKGKYKQVHRLVHEAHIGKLEEGYDAHHINGDEEDNFVENLESKEHRKHTSDHHRGKIISENTKKMMRESKKGKIVSEETKNKISKNHADFKGKNNPNYGKGISNQKIIDIQIDIEKGDLIQQEIAKKYGVCRNTISNIKTGIIKTK